MDLTIPKDNAKFFKQIWTILGITKIPRNDLISKICYKFSLPYNQTSINTKIDEAVSQGILLDSKKFLRLNDQDLEEIATNHELIRQKIIKNSQKSWSRIEGSYDQWMNSIEKKKEFSDKKSLNFNAVVKKVVPYEVLIKGRDIAANEFEYDVKNDVITGTVKNTDYSFKIDLKNKKIVHNCQEFVDSIPNKGFCEHFYRIFMYLKRKYSELAVNVIISLQDEKKDWKFAKS